ncbi:hypothetical protein [Rathayibacter soli]|uniref:hypothetical protein n=1 Tax=Rathayibacter soli TaxID=3144168 RepID=UPI0027E4B6B1|nr:hypothetical protein [Glaciibacter superstes]
MSGRKRSAARLHLANAIALELSGGVIAFAAALIMVMHLADTQRSWLLFYDSDSVFPALVHGSLAVGQPQDWAMSSVLFIPELIVYLGLAALGLSVKATFILNAIVNLVAVYASFRFVAGCAMPGRARSSRIVGALLAIAGVTVFVLLDSTANRNSLELVSLVATTTYYSATIIGMILTVGLVVRILSPCHRVADGPFPSKSQRISWVPAVVLALVATLSILTNPLYLAWSAVPVAIAVVAVGIPRLVSRLSGVVALGAVGAGAIAGLLLRVPLAPWITMSGVSYARPDLFGRSLLYYTSLLRMRLETLPGVLSIVFVFALIAVNIAIFVRRLRRRDTAGMLVAGLGWITPVVVTAGAILLGTDAARYLEPVFFAPLLGLCVVLAVLRRERVIHRSLRGELLDPKGNDSRLVRRNVETGKPTGSKPATQLLASATAGVLAVGVLASIIIATPRLVVEANRVDSDVQCVDQWVTDSGEIGVGEYWTIRGPKAYLPDPSQLVQVTSALNAYPWLVNRTDFEATRASFVIVSRADPPLEVPAGLSAAATRVTHCGRYTIVDYGHPALPIGPLPRSR